MASIRRNPGRAAEAARTPTRKPRARTSSRTTRSCIAIPACTSARRCDPHTLHVRTAPQLPLPLPIYGTVVGAHVAESGPVKWETGVIGASGAALLLKLARPAGALELLWPGGAPEQCAITRRHAIRVQGVQTATAGSRWSVCGVCVRRQTDSASVLGAAGWASGRRHSSFDQCTEMGVVLACWMERPRLD